MVKVKIIKDDEISNYKEYIGNTYEAFMDNNAYTEGYCVNILGKMMFVPKEYCEEINEGIGQIGQNEKVKYDKVLLVEDGSVDVDYIEEDLGIKCIVYRQGANKPEWLETGE